MAYAYKIAHILRDQLGWLWNLIELSEELLEPAHPISERWPLLHRPLGFAAWLVQELICRTHPTLYDSRAQKLADFWQP